MTASSKAKIFLADERGVDEADLFRSYQTFNFGKFFNEHKIPFGDLYALNDDTLAGASFTKNEVHEHSYIVLLPVVGAINYSDSLGNESLVNAGEVQVIALGEGFEFEVLNPYEKEPVNFLQLSIKAPSFTVFSSALVKGFDLASDKNKLIEVADISESLRLSLGQFDGREEALYRLKDGSNRLFVFVIEGAFEVHGRLLHPRDGLALWELDGPVELEALSNEAIILMVEMLS